MPAVQRSEFALALNQVATERGVDVDVVLDTVKNAIVAAYRKDHPGVEVEEYTADLNPNTGEARIMHDGKDVTPPGFGRIAAQTAKQVILQKIREKEKEAIITDYRDKIGQIVNGTVLRFAGPNVIVDIGKTEAMMPPQEQIQNEKYYQNQRLVVFLKDIREGIKGEEVIVSRSDNGLLEGLFRREVPEVAQGSVIIKTIVREPGNRAKVAVSSTQSGIDPVGSCVGQKGVRVQAIIQEVGGIEKIDIIQWQDDITAYIAAALSPAKNVNVHLNQDDKSAKVTVPQDELSLAIGKDGQNVRLASKLTEYRIEIEGDQLEPKPLVAEEKIEEAKETKEPEEKVEKVEDVVEAVESKEEAVKNSESEVASEERLAEEAKEIVDATEGQQVAITPEDEAPDKATIKTDTTE